MSLGHSRFPWGEKLKPLPEVMRVAILGVDVPACLEFSLMKDPGQNHSTKPLTNL